MPCPEPADRRIKACKPKTTVAAVPTSTTPDPKNPNCDDAKAEPVIGRVIKNEIQGGDVLDHDRAPAATTASQKGWTGTVLRGDEPTRRSHGGDVTVIRVDKQRDDRQGAA